MSALLIFTFHYGSILITARLKLLQGKGLFTFHYGSILIVEPYK